MNLFEQNNKREMAPWATIWSWWSNDWKLSVNTLLTENIRFDEIDRTFFWNSELFLQKNGNMNHSRATLSKIVCNRGLADAKFIQKSDQWPKNKNDYLWMRTNKLPGYKNKQNKVLVITFQKIATYHFLLERFIFSRKKSVKQYRQGVGLLRKSNH